MLLPPPLRPAEAERLARSAAWVHGLAMLVLAVAVGGTTALNDCVLMV